MSARGGTHPKGMCPLLKMYKVIDKYEYCDILEIKQYFRFTTNMMLKILILVCCALMVAGCPYLKTKRTAYTKSYSLNVEEQASTGVPMISSGYTKYAKTYAKHELSEEQDKWQSFEYQTRDAYREELIYNGRKDDQLFFSYKRYTRAHASPASSDKLIHDLKSSDVLLFRNYKIKVLNATNEYIRFMVLDD